jgi:hypothetical protein
MSHSPLRKGCARVAWLALAVAWPSVSMAAGPPVQISTSAFLDRLGLITSGGPRPIQVAGKDNGLVALAWHASPTVVQARVYSAFGPPQTPVVDVTTQAYEGQVAIDMDPAGGFLVAWLQDKDATTQLATLLGRRYRADGSPATPELVLASSVVPGSLYADFLLELAPDGSFVAAWQTSAPGALTRLMVQGFDGSGVPKGPPSSVSETNLYPYYANLAMSVQGDLGVIAYGQPRSGTSGAIVSDVRARRFDATGALRSPEITVALPQLDDFSHLPSGVVVFPDGRFALGYEHCDPVSMDGVCQTAGDLWVDAAGISSGSLGGVLAQGRFAGRGLAPDALGNFGTLVVDSQLNESFAATNPLGAVAAQAGLGPPPPTTPVVGGFTLIGFTSIGVGQFALVWYDLDWTYIQTIALGSESTSAPNFYTLEPCRLIDTRDTGAMLMAGNDLAVQVSGHCSVPAGARAVTANLVSVGSTDPGDLRFYRADRLVPTTSAVNYGAGQVRASAAVIPLDPQGALAVRASQPKGTTHLIIDVSGYFQ